MLRTFITTLLFIGLAAVAQAEKLRVHSPGDGFLNLRTGPGTGYAIVREMYNGQTVRILERKGSWVRVRHSSGATGWASAKYLQ